MRKMPVAWFFLCNVHINERHNNILKLPCNYNIDKKCNKTHLFLEILFEKASFYLRKTGSLLNGLHFKSNPIFRNS